MDDGIADAVLVDSLDHDKDRIAVLCEVYRHHVAWIVWHLDWPDFAGVGDVVDTSDSLIGGLDRFFYCRAGDTRHDGGECHADGEKVDQS